VRYGLLADVHANLPALDAAVAALRRVGVDEWLVAGDVVGYGPHPNECVERLVDLGATCVAGNHDRYACGLLGAERLPPWAGPSLRWTRQQLTSDASAFLSVLPDTVHRGELVVAHGSLDDVEEYITTPDQAERQLERARRSVGEEVATVVLGHTHHQWLVGAGADVRPGTVMTAPRPPGPHLVNPGSVGQSRQRERRPLCRYAVLDTTAGTVAFGAEGYDDEATRQALRRLGLPERGVHLAPRRWPRTRRAVRRVLSRHRNV
jgi:predicted phosphodiesterase